METVLHWIEAGGPIVVILGLLSFYSLALIALKLFHFRATWGGGKAREEAIKAFEKSRREEAIGMVAGSANPVDQVLTVAMEGLAQRWESDHLREEIDRQANRQTESLGRFLRTLEVLAVVSPLMGLLGTVLGMIESFQQLELAGGSANAAVLAAGIWQALLTTAMGLIVAIPAAIASNLLGARLEGIGHQIEDAVTRVLLAGKSRAR